MANLIKPKIGISILSISVLILIPLLESNFNAPVTIKRWSKLAWEDFQGFAQPFSGYEAVISSTVYLEYDSSSSTYHAYAGQNNIRSWAKRSSEYMDYALNHEQYHFNITELHARYLNNYIAENPSQNESLYLLRLGSINIDLRRMQRKYDAETSHSLIFDKQRRWEFKIDSLLVLDSGWITDKFSGARAYLPSKAILSKGISRSQSRYRDYSLNKYGMSFNIASLQNESFDDSILFRIMNTYPNRKDTLKTFTIENDNNSLKASLFLKDSSNRSSYSVWIYNRKYLYNILATYPNNAGDTTGYYQIAISFVNSFSIVNTDSLWIAELENSSSPITYSNVNKKEKSSGENTQYCLGIGKSEQRGFYRGPFFRDDGAMFLSYDHLVHADSLHYKDILLVNKDLYSFSPTPEGQIYFVPKSNIPNGKYQIDFGYILKKDSTKECYEFYHESLEITPKVYEFSHKER